MIPLIAFIVLVVVVLVLIEIRERRRAKKPTANSQQPTAEQRPEGCCGEHLVCERETLLQTNAEVVYYDDEELDTLAGKDAADYTDEEADQIREVFRTLKEEDVTGWVRSMQLRGIQLPEDVREEALLIVRERRKR